MRLPSREPPRFSKEGRGSGEAANGCCHARSISLLHRTPLPWRGSHQGSPNWRVHRGTIRHIRHPFIVVVVGGGGVGGVVVGVGGVLLGGLDGGIVGAHSGVGATSGRGMQQDKAVAGSHADCVRQEQAQLQQDERADGAGAVRGRALEEERDPPAHGGHEHVLRDDERGEANDSVITKQAAHQAKLGYCDARSANGREEEARGDKGTGEQATVLRFQRVHTDRSEHCARELAARRSEKHKVRRRIPQGSPEEGRHEAAHGRQHGQS